MAQPSNQDDRVTQANESGEPKESGRSRGEIIDDQGEAAGKTKEAQRIARKPGADFESGRQQATP
jgi:hypothetical protein